MSDLREAIEVFRALDEDVVKARKLRAMRARGVHANLWPTKPSGKKPNRPPLKRHADFHRMPDTKPRPIAKKNDASTQTHFRAPGGSWKQGRP